MCGGGDKSGSEGKEEGGCCSCNCCGGGGEKGEKMQLWKQKKNELVDYKFKDVDVSKFRDTSIKGIRKYITMLTASMNYFLYIALDVQIAYWLFQADPNLYPNAQASGIAYAVITGLNWAWIGYNVYKAYNIIKSDDISDAFTHSESYRIRNIMSYDVFCFFIKLTAKRTCRDKMVLFIADSVKQLPQLIAVKAPQVAIMMVNHDALNVFASSSQGEIPKSQASADMKFGLLMMELGARMFAVCILYPWVRCCMNRDSLPEYANYLIESRVNALVKSGKADINEKEDEEQGGGGCCGK